MTIPIEEQLFNRLANARTQHGGVLPKDRWLQVVREFYGEAIRAAVDAARPAPRTAKAKPGALRARNPIFDAIAEACRLGESTKLTRPMAKRVAVAMTDIKQVAPDVTPEQIQSAANRFRQRHPQWELTATALSTHWAEVAGGPATRAARRDPEQEPQDWQALATKAFPGIDLPARWTDMSRGVRSDILERTA